jgi:hypothetical protein
MNKDLCKVILQHEVIKVFRKKEFMDWESYKNKVDLLDVFHWQQSVRRQSLRNI